MKKILKSMAMSCLFLGAAILTGCTGEQYHIEGEISNAKDSVLYFEHNSLKGFTTVDSVKLDEKGNFSFAGDKAENPEFYRLRIAAVSYTHLRAHET